MVLGLGMMAGGAGLAALGSVGQYLGAREQAGAARDATASQERILREQMDRADEAGLKARRKIETGKDYARGYLKEGYGAARDDISGGYGDAIGTIGSGMQQARSTLADNLQPVTGLMDYAGGATTAVGGRDITQAGGALGQLMSGQIGQDYEQSAGFQARLNAGQQAIQQSAAARGGRLGAGTLQALAAHGQGLAAQDYNQYVQQQMGQAGQQAGVLSSQAAREQQAALAAQGNQMGLAGMGFGAQADMARGLSGMTAAEAQQTAGLQQGQGAALAGLSQGQGTSLADLYMQAGMAKANVLTGGAAVNAGLGQSLGQAQQAGVPYAGQGMAALGSGLGNLGQGAMIYGLSKM